MVEGLTGVLFLLVGRYFFDLADQATWLEALWLLGLVALFVVIAVYDILNMEILVSVLWMVLIWTLLYYGLSFEGGESLWWGREMQALGGALVVGGFFLTLVLVSHETWMGWGDVWLGALSGLIVGLPAVLFMMTLSFGIGALIGIGLLVFGQKGMKAQLPFAPFLVLGTLLTLLLPQMIPDYTWAFFL
jgi:leader peptidase (prepilin peptidase)/N-methyltransferase